MTPEPAPWTEYPRAPLPTVALDSIATTAGPTSFATWLMDMPAAGTDATGSPTVTVSAAASVPGAAAAVTPLDWLATWATGEPGTASVAAAAPTLAETRQSTRAVVTLTLRSARVGRRPGCSVRWPGAGIALNRIGGRPRSLWYVMCSSPRVVYRLMDARNLAWSPCNERAFYRCTGWP